MIQWRGSGAVTLVWVFAALLQSVCWFALGFSPVSLVSIENLAGPPAETAEIPSLIARFEALRTSRDRSAAVWTEPPPPSDGQWWYDVFTPPRIFIHPLTGMLEPTAYQFETPVQLPSLELEGIRYPLFRYQLVGFVEEAVSDASNAILLIEDRESGQTRRLRFVEGGALDHGYRTTSLLFKRSRQESGAVSREATLMLQSPEGKAMHLQSGTATLSDQIVLQLRLGEERFELPEVGSSKRIGPYEVSWMRTLSADTTRFECVLSHHASNTVQPITLTAPTQPNP